MQTIHYTVANLCMILDLVDDSDNTSHVLAYEGETMFKLTVKRTVAPKKGLAVEFLIDLHILDNLDITPVLETPTITKYKVGA